MLRRLPLAAAALALLASPAAPLSPFFVFFGSGSAAITEQARPALDNAVEQTAYMEARGIVIEASADRVGSDAANLRLSRRRAEAVKAYLVARGVPGAIIGVTAHGETGQPLVATADGVAEPQNRFAAVIISRPCLYPTARGIERMAGC